MKVVGGQDHPAIRRQVAFSSVADAAILLSGVKHNDNNKCRCVYIYIYVYTLNRQTLDTIGASHDYLINDVGSFALASVVTTPRYILTKLPRKA